MFSMYDYIINSSILNFLSAFPLSSIHCSVIIMSETIVPLIETLPEKLDDPPKTLDAVVKFQDMQKKSKSGHRKYLWISFVSNAITALFTGVMTYMSYVMSNIGEVAHFATLTVILLVAQLMIFTLLRLKKGRRVRGYHVKICLVLYYLAFTNILERLLVGHLFNIFGGEILGSSQNICKRIYENLMLITFISMIVASFVLLRAAIKRRGREMIPLDPVPKIAAWETVSLEELNENREPGQV